MLTVANLIYRLTDAEDDQQDQCTQAENRPRNRHDFLPEWSQQKMVTFAQNWQRCRAAQTSSRSRPILIGRREDDLLSGGFRRRGARCCVVVSREEEEPECSQVPEHRRNTVSRSGCGILDAFDSRRNREPQKVPSIKLQERLSP